MKDGRAIRLVSDGTTPHVTPIERDDKLPEVGAWFWVDESALARARKAKPQVEEDEGFEDEDEAIDISVRGLDLDVAGGASDEDDDDEEEPNRWLGAVTHVGSNFVRIQGYTGSEYGSTQSTRVHLDFFDAACTPEPEADRIITANAARHAANARVLMGKVQEITQRLGVAPRAEIGEGATGETQALAVRGSGESVDKYKRALIRAKTQELPALFKSIEKENKITAGWMTAQLIPMQAKADALQPAIKAIEKRIFSVELYAGLKEKVVLVSDGKPTPIGTKITLMQRRCYMDEESLAQYEAGGMDYKDVRDFDQWLARPVNRDRILPAQRCVVAFQVRRFDKEREAEDLTDFIRIFSEREADKQTYLYIRNGEKLYRLKTSIDFGEELFPDMDRLDTTQRLYVKRGRNSDREFIISEGLYLQHVAADVAHEASKRTVTYTYKGGKTENVEVCSCNESTLRRPEPQPPGPWFWCTYRSVAAEYELYTQDSVYYDDATQHLADEMERHNRLLLVLQGLMDRSPVFHPHPQWRLWTHEGFAAGLSLVYDSKRALTPGEAPDFEAYRSRLNASLGVGSMTVGQERAWEEREADKENAKYTRGRSLHYRRYRPHGDPGPGTIARVAEFKPRAKACVYRWEKAGPSKWDYARRDYFSTPVQRMIQVPVGRLLNVDAYKPGDFHQFFDDPRTRALYIEWAPLLLAAEDYHGKKKK